MKSIFCLFIVILFTIGHFTPDAQGQNEDEIPGGSEEVQKDRPRQLERSSGTAEQAKDKFNEEAKREGALSNWKNKNNIPGGAEEKETHGEKF